MLLFHIALNGARNIYPVKVCVSDHDGIDKLYIGNASGTHTLKQFRKSMLKSVNVKAFTFDSLIDLYGIDHVDILKCDVEGAELDVIKGMSKSLTSGIVDKITLEWHSKPIMKKLLQIFRSYGYKCKVCTFLSDDTTRLNIGYLYVSMNEDVFYED